jgi:diguanylate cyclase (GGDEF)-like protein
MDSTSIKILLINNSLSFSSQVSDMLSKANMADYGLSDIVLLYDNSFSDGLKDLVNAEVDIVLFELSLSDSEYLLLLDSACSVSHIVPVVIVSDNKDKKTALLAIQAGAQDYLVKDEFSTEDLVRSLLFSVERYRLEKERHGASFIDELTGLYSHVGFKRVGEKHTHIASRTGQEILVVYAELRGLEYINAVYGYDKGNECLLKAGKILKKSLRNSDIVARVGWDKFAALAIGVNENTTQIITKRLQEKIQLNSINQDIDFAPTLSYGMAYFRPTLELKIDEMLRRAEEAMLVSRDEVLIY